MLRKLIENVNPRRKSNGEVSPTKDKSITVKVRSLGFNSSGRRTMDCDDEDPELQSPRTIHIPEDSHSSDSSSNVNCNSLLLCKNCSSKYYRAYELQSSIEFCSKDCEACYSFLTGRKL